MGNSYKTYKKENAGFIQAIIVIVVALIVLGYYGYNLAEIISRPAVNQNLSFGWGIAKSVWNDFLRTPTLALWSYVGPLLHAGISTTTLSGAAATGAGF